MTNLEIATIILIGGKDMQAIINVIEYKMNKQKP